MFKTILSSLSFVVFLSITSGCASTAANQTETKCEETRAAFDIGSGTTRMLVARVNHCEQKVLGVVAKEERPVPYKDDLERSGSKGFSVDVQAKGLSTLKELSEIAKSKGATRFVGVATSAFRSAPNAEEFLERIEKDASVKLRAIDQQTEAELGFAAATSQPEVDASSVVVWDIGGGSMQFSSRVGTAVTTSLVEMGSVSFKNLVLKTLRPKADLSESPNPIGKKNFGKVMKLAKDHAVKNTTQNMRELLQQRKVIGIGGVHYHSVRKQSGQAAIFDSAAVEKTLKSKIDMSDEKVGGAYAATDVSNLILVLGYMQALNIDSVHAVNANLTDGIIVYPSFWAR